MSPEPQNAMGLRVAVCTVCGVLLLLGGLFCDQSAERKRAAPEDRIVEKALKDLDYNSTSNLSHVVLKRAVEELAAAVPQSERVRSVLIRRLLDPGPRLDPCVLDFVKALSRSDAAQVKTFVAAYKEGKPAQDRLERLLYLIGFMGPKAESAAPFLMEQLRTYESDPKMSSAIMAVLANVNPAQSDVVEAVRRQIAALSENAYPALWTLSTIGPGEWVDERVASDLVKWLEEPRHDADAAAASVLGRLREKGRLGLVRLKGLLAAVEEDKSRRTYRIVYGMALAKIDSSERQLFLRRVFKYAGGPEGGNHTDWDCLRRSAFALEPDMVEAVVQLIGDEDPDVVLGAASMVFYIGMEARGAGPALMRVLESSSEDTAKARAAEALAVVGDQSYVPEIRQLLEKESDPTVKETLMLAIQVLSEYGR